MRKCYKCDKKAQVYLPQHRLAFCKDHYLEWFDTRVEKTIKEFKMFDKSSKILVAVSGGKDSLSLWNALAKLGYNVDGINPGMDKNAAIASFNVVPPDLSNIAAIVDHKFLAAFIKNPQEATKNPKFAMPPMAQLSDEDVANIIAYLSSVAKKDLTGKEIVVEACGRCHSVKYQKIEAETPKDNLKAYLGKIPPDLSVMGKAKELEYLESFINNPQNGLPGTSMPRLGLTKEATEKTVVYLDQIADPHRDQRNRLGVFVLGYLLVMAGLTFAWKKKIWKNIH